MIISKMLLPPCSYQGGKQRLAKQIVDIILQENKINDNTKFYDLCCGSGAISLELINRGINPSKIIMIDNGCFGAFWQAIADNKFELSIFKNEIDKLPNKEYIQLYLQKLSNQEVNEKFMIYHYLLLQAGAFGSKQIWIENNRWKNNTFRSYWQPTKTSNRKSPVNPMMPMPETLYERVENIVIQLSGRINAFQENVFDTLYRLDEEWESGNNNLIIYIDPPYINTTGYKEGFDIYELERGIWNNVPIYISEGFQMDGANNTYLLSKGRVKGNISGNINKNPIQEWLNKFTHNI